VISRLVFALVGWWGAVNVHAMVARPTWPAMRAEGRAIAAIAGPAILTNIATPFATAVVARIARDRAAGFDVQPFDSLGRPVLDITLPVPLPAAQASALASLGLAPPGGPSLVVELLPAPPAGASPAR
jgi:hypothetical protein